MFVQVGLGVAAMNQLDLEPPDIHMFYGFLTLFTVGIAYAYRQQLQKIYFWYGVFGLFIMGLGIRAVLVGTR